MADFALSKNNIGPFPKETTCSSGIDRFTNKGLGTRPIPLTLQELLDSVGAVEGVPLGFGEPAALACVRILNMDSLAGLGTTVGEEIALWRDGHPAALLEGIKCTYLLAGLGVPQPGRTEIL